jgi:signal transduction histidine kinase/ligand-binding sensor domain-containing protein
MHSDVAPRRRPHRAQIAALALLLLVPVFGAQPGSPWALRTWQTDDGLPNNQVTGLTQTTDGYLWIATYSALARFDGVRFEEYLPRDIGLGSNQKLTALGLSRTGAMYVGMVHGGIVRLDGKQLHVFDQGVPYKPVETIVETGDGAIWAVYQGGTILRLQGDNITTFGTDDGLPRPDTPTRYGCAITTDDAGQLWFAKNGHVGVFREGRFASLAAVPPLGTRITAAHAGGVWISCGSELYSIKSGRQPELRATLPTSATAEPTVVFEDHTGSVWIGTTAEGLFRFDGTHVESVATSDQRITSVYEDRKGNIWVGTFGAGLNRVRPRIVTLETAATGLPTGIIQSLTQDKNGTIWATTPTGLLLHRHGTQWETVSEGSRWPGGRASTVAADPSGAVWIGTRDRGLYRWQDGVYTLWRRDDGLASREIHAMLVSRNGDVWLGCTGPDIVQRLHQGTLRTYQMPDGVRVIRAIAEDTAGNIWIASSRGILARIHGDTVTDETPTTTGDPISIRCLHATPDGGVWIGYADESVGWWKDGRFRHIIARDGFPENNVSQIILDGTGWLWFGGDHGIFKVRQAALERLANGEAGSPHFIRYGDSEGLFSIEANFGDAPGTLRSSDGRLWFPLRTALAIIDPSQTREDTQPPSVLLKDVVVDDKTIADYGGPVPLRDRADMRNLTPQLHLEPRHLRLGFAFTALSFGAPENVRFRYQLEGFDRGWVDAGASRTATYSRLPAGTYRFRVIACNSDGVWNEDGATLRFTVDPFVWQTWWFRLGVVLAFSTVIAVVARRLALRRVRERLRQLEQQAAVHKERSRIARDLHDEFGTRLTELGLLAELRRKAGPDDGGALIENIRALERDLDTIVWTVNPKNDTLDHLIDFICRVSAEFLGRSGIRCRFDIPDDLPAWSVSPEFRHNVFLVVREAVNNVVRHAQATCVKVAVKLEGHSLSLQVENDGPGFTVDLAAKSGRNGLQNMRSRIEELGGTFDLRSDLSSGTIVGIRLPLIATATETTVAPRSPSRVNGPEVPASNLPRTSSPLSSSQLP